MGGFQCYLIKYLDFLFTFCKIRFKFQKLRILKMSFAIGLSRSASGVIRESEQSSKEDINLSKSNIRAIILFQFKRNVNAANCLCEMKSALGENVVQQRTIYNYYKRFGEGNFRLEDEERTGRPIKLRDDELKEIITRSPSIIVQELAEEFNVCEQTIRNRLHSIGYSPKLSKWVPHELSQFNKFNRVRVCELLLNFFQKIDFFPFLITCDEKWVYYNNQPRTRDWLPTSEQPKSIAKTGLTNKKVLLCCYWSIYGIEYYEFLNSGQTINSEVYCEQLIKVDKKVRRTWPSHILKKGIFFHQDNARPHTAINTKRTILNLNWTTIEHAPCSPDKSPSDYYLFQNLQHNLDGTTFKTKNETIEAVKDYFDSREPDFFKKGIYKLPERWQKIVEKNGDYLDN